MNGNDVLMTHRLNMLWVDLTVASRGKDVFPIGMETHFDIERVDELGHLSERIERGLPDVVSFDFDYPDRESLQLMVDAKKAHRSTPMLMVTLQHSEKLAVWAFRNKLVDFLVKPVPQVDIDRCHCMLLEIARAKAGQESRGFAGAAANIPGDIASVTRTVDRAFLPAIYHVIRNFDSKIQNDEVANLCAMSPFRFSRGFKEVFGISFRDYVIRYRLRQACHLLKNPNASVTEVAFAVGFSDVSHFSKMFKRYLGVSPSHKWLSNAEQTGDADSPTVQLRIPPDLLQDSVA